MLSTQHRTATSHCQHWLLATLTTLSTQHTTTLPPATANTACWPPSLHCQHTTALPPATVNTGCWPPSLRCQHNTPPHCHQPLSTLPAGHPHYTVNTTHHHTATSHCQHRLLATLTTLSTQHTTTLPPATVNTGCWPPSLRCQHTTPPHCHQPLSTLAAGHPHYAVNTTHHHTATSHCQH